MVFMLISNFLFGQYNDQITFKKEKPKGYLYNGQSIAPKDLQELLKSYPESAIELKRSKIFLTTGLILMGSTVICEGIFLVQTVKQALDINNGDPNYSIAILGAGLAVGSLACVITSSYFSNKSIKLYNSKPKNIGQNPLQLQLQLSSNGLGVSMRF